MSRAPDVVLDTNLVLSTLVFTQGRLTWLRRAWQDGGYRPLASQATIAELMRALTYPKFRLSAEEQRELLADYLPYCLTVPMAGDLPATLPCRDPFDVPFLQLALIGKADYLVTGDRDLLSLAPRFACPIVTAEEFLASLGRTGSEATPGSRS